jgi:hypothetical protein
MSADQTTPQAGLVAKLRAEMDDDAAWQSVQDMLRVQSEAIERLRAALTEIAAGSYPLPLREDAAAWIRLASMRKDIAQRALDHG